MDEYFGPLVVKSANLGMMRYGASEMLEPVKNAIGESIRISKNGKTLGYVVSRLDYILFEILKERFPESERASALEELKKRRTAAVVAEP